MNYWVFMHDVQLDYVISLVEDSNFQLKVIVLEPEKFPTASVNQGFLSLERPLGQNFIACLLGSCNEF